MEKILTDPELATNDDNFEFNESVKQKLSKIDYIISVNKKLEQRIMDLETSLKLNKEIIVGMIDAI